MCAMQQESERITIATGEPIHLGQNPNSNFRENGRDSSATVGTYLTVRTLVGLAESTEGRPIDTRIPGFQVSLTLIDNETLPDTITWTDQTTGNTYTADANYILVTTTHNGEVYNETIVDTYVTTAVDSSNQKIHIRTWRRR